MLSLNPETVKRLNANQNTLVAIFKATDKPTATVAQFVEAVGYAEAVETVATMVNSITNHWDERISGRNYVWAAEHTAVAAIGNPFLATFFKTDSIHPAHLDQIADAMRKAPDPTAESFLVRTFDEDGDTVTEEGYATEAEAVEALPEAMEDGEAVHGFVEAINGGDIVYTVTKSYRYHVERTYDGEAYFSTADEVADSIAEELADDEAAYDEMLDECYDSIDIFGASYSPSEVLKKVDPIAYRCGKSDWADAERSDILYTVERMDEGESECFYGFDVTLEAVIICYDTTTHEEEIKPLAA